MKREDSPRRCTAMLSDGSRRCMNYAIRGTTVCRYHGGAAPQVKRSARELLDSLAEPAVAALAQVLRMVEQTPRLAIHPGVQRAISSVLDRTGYVRASKVELDDLAERETRRSGELIAEVLTAVVQDAGIELTVDLRKLIRYHLGRVVGGAPDLPTPETAADRRKARAWLEWAEPKERQVVLDVIERAEARRDRGEPPSRFRVEPPATPPPPPPPPAPEPERMRL